MQTCSLVGAVRNIQFTQRIQWQQPSRFIRNGKIYCSEILQLSYTTEAGIRSTELSMFRLVCLLMCRQNNSPESEISVQK